MRLLNKTEISKAQASDRAREINEGLKISRRVDDLRELQAKEEQVLEKFRSESLAVIAEELKVLEAKKEAKSKELAVLEEAAKRELSKTDRKRLEDLKISLEKRVEELTEKSYELDLKEIDIALSLKEAEDQVERMRSHEQTTKMLHEQAEREKSEANQVLANAKAMEVNVLRSKEESERVFTFRENEVRRREQESVVQAQANLKVSHELAQEKKQVADQRATLQRALDRLKNNRLA